MPENESDPPVSAPSVTSEAVAYFVFERFVETLTVMTFGVALGIILVTLSKGDR